MQYKGEISHYRANKNFQIFVCIDTNGAGEISRGDEDT